MGPYAGRVSEATDTLVEKLAVEYFFKGCHDNQAALAVSGGRHKIRTVQKAVKAMKKYVCTSQQLLGSKASTYSHRQRQVTFQDTNTKVGSTPTITSDAIKEIVRSALSDALAKMMSTMEQNILDKLTMRTNLHRGIVPPRLPSRVSSVGNQDIMLENVHRSRHQAVPDRLDVSRARNMDIFNATAQNIFK